MKARTIEFPRWLIAGALSTVLVGGAFWYAQPAPSSDSQRQPPDTRVSERPSVRAEASHGMNDQLPPAPAPEPPQDQSYQTPTSLGPDPFAPSLAGTQIDGALKAGADGRLVVDLRVRDFFDYFLSTVGEVSPETAIGQIERMSRNHLPEAAANRALVLLDQYLAYKQAALSVMQTELDPALREDPAYQLRALSDALAGLKQLRQATFDAETHQAFFGLEEAYSEYTLASLAIQQRDDLSSQGKQALIEWHRNQLPETLRKTEKRLHATTRQQQARVAAIDAAGSPTDAGQRLAELGLPAEEVTSVVNYLESRERFEGRFEDFRQAMNEQDASGLSAADRDRYQEALLEQYFPDKQDRTWARLKMLGNS